MQGRRGRTCSICSDPRVTAINAALVDVESETISVLKISREFDVPYQSLNRHYKNHIQPTVKALVTQAMTPKGEKPLPLPDVAPDSISALTFDLANGMARAHRVMDKSVTIGEKLVTEAEQSEDQKELAQYADFASRQADRSLRGIHGTVGAKAVAMIVDSVEERIENSREERLLAYLLNEDAEQDIALFGTNLSKGTTGYSP